MYKKQSMNKATLLRSYDILSGHFLVFDFGRNFEIIKEQNSRYYAKACHQENNAV